MEKKKFPGTILAGLYKTRGGLQERGMPLTQDFLERLVDAVNNAGEGSRLILKPVKAESKKAADEKHAAAGKKGTSPDSYLVIYTKEELDAEREQAQSNSL